MSHARLSEIPDDLLFRDSHRGADADRGRKLAKWLTYRGIRATELHLQAERDRRTALNTQESA